MKESKKSHADVTRPVRDNMALDSAERYFDTVYDKAPVMLHSINNNGRIVKVNGLWLANLGYRANEVVGRPSTDFLTEASRARALIEILPFFWRTGSCHSIEYQFVKRDGRVLDLLLDAELSHNEAGRPMTIAALYRGDDLVQWKQASATIKAIQALADVRQSSEDVLYSPPDPKPDPGALLAGRSRSHEFSAPIVSIYRSARLTPRELEVIRLIASGARNKEIAEQLSLSVRTVRFHSENIYQKLSVQTRTQAVRVATESGVLAD